ncbi:PhzF family phenazine biosynthesis protein [Massilia sp. R2A-15]|uniref:PhzF family phenazine biosynthesis protein n=1 Tax=Massilia sp. R2A-15 TaxID=3064278 RepID=UPI002736F3FF|nr:PhzF family phenazine biosynthesis protein [Massilia sp. R2A-15]WLI87773.1 PhzF family phenazine biosynthesis protein [Massilia sp. R2A-15]
MRSLSFKQVDVFTNVRFMGNPVAVVLEGEGLSGIQMQRIANWTNLSETTFVLPATEAGADYRLRIFTPNAELPFAGHPTIGTAHALIESGAVQPKDGVLVQQCAAGLVRLEVSAEAGGERWIAFDLPAARFTSLSADHVGELEMILGASLEREPPPKIVDVGPRWLTVQLESAEAVLALQPDMARMKAHDLRIGITGIVVFGEYPAGHCARIEVRAFVPAHGIDEDPVCGSGNGAVGAFIRDSGQVHHFGSDFIAAEGVVVGRAGVVRLSVSPGRIRVAGKAVTCIEGSLRV